MLTTCITELDKITLFSVEDCNSWYHPAFENAISIVKSFAATVCVYI